MLIRSMRRASAPAVHAGSMADIAFLLLIFFLVTTTIAEDSGVLVRLPPWIEDPIVENSTQVLTVLLNADDQLLVEEQAAHPADLPRTVYDFVRSPKRTPRQAVISLVHDRSSSYTQYVAVYDGLLAGYELLWNEEANRRYGKAYALLSDTQKKAIRSDIPLILSEAEPNDAATGS